MNDYTPIGPAHEDIKPSSKEIEEAINVVAEVCRAAGGRLTRSRAQVLTILMEARGPVSAYVILEKLVEHRPWAKAPTVYRALSFLQQYKIVRRIEGLNEYVIQSQPGQDINPVLLICTNCRSVREIENKAIGAERAKICDAAGFVPSLVNFEILGLCAKCSAVAGDE